MHAAPGLPPASLAPSAGPSVAPLPQDCQVKAAPQDEEPERFLFWGGAGQFVDLLAKVGGAGGWETGGGVPCKWRTDDPAAALPQRAASLLSSARPHAFSPQLLGLNLAVGSPAALQEVERLGGTIVCKAPVRHIDQTLEGVVVTSDAGT